MPKIKNLGKQIVDESTEKKPRGRPKGSKNAPKKKKVLKGTETDKVYRYYFIADACGCRYGVNVIGSGMWCEHKNSMHLEDRKRYTETEYIANT
jgi:hypothetical protein